MLGGFVVGALALLVVAAILFGSGKVFKKTSLRVMYFDGSVKGLNVGAPVLFRGVSVGSVKGMSLHWDTNKKELDIPVVIEIEPDRFKVVGGSVAKTAPAESHKELVERGLRAQLEMQSFVTGQLLVALDFHPGTPFTLHEDAPYLEIPTIPTTMQQIAKALEQLPLEELVNRLTSAVTAIDRKLNSPAMDSTIKNLDESLNETRKLVANINSKVGPIASSIEEMFKEYGKLARNVESKVGSMTTSITDVAGEARTLIKRTDGSIDDIARSLSEALTSADSALKQAENTLITVQGVAGEASDLRYLFVDTLQGISAAARSIRIAADYIQMHPEALVIGKPGGK
jgi:paraquat-inducible protein B